MVASARGRLARWLSSLGPGVITGAADDDPSGIATYSTAGALLGTQLLWTALVTWPLMAAVQTMCARVGMMSGKGLAGAFHHRLPKWIVVAFSAALLAANALNIGADLSGMADAAQMLTGWSAHLFVALFGLAISVATIRCSYHRIASTLKWLALVLFAYVITAFLVTSNWSEVVHDTFVPSWPSGHEGWSMIVAILGTTISPYLFYWQASQEVEEEKAAGRRMLARRRGATRAEVGLREVDIGIGTFFSNLVMYFIILTTALTLHRHGLIHIETSRQAAEALRPLAGRLAALLFTLGVLGVGFLAIPTLTGSAAYALAETFGWHQGLNAKFKSARGFYGVIIGSTLIGIALNFTHISPIAALYYTAVINGLVAPFLLLGVLFVAVDKRTMHNQPSSPLNIATVGLTTALMFAAAVGMFVY